MYLKSIVLRDWKAYTVGSFDFPAPEVHRNIILIGAQNGFGKTSLFEAIVLGLFGQSGLPLVARSPFSSDDKQRLATSYRAFLEKAIHSGAIDAGRTSCSVKLCFVDDGEEIEIQRIWYFTDKGALRPGDEEVRIYEGTTKRVVGPTAADDGEDLEWYRDFIARRFLPYYLAAFFLFDGEQVSAFAEREMAAQVRSGIEGLLGIPVLKELAQDLRAYARVRKGEVNNVSDRTIDRIELDLDNLNLQLGKRKERVAELEPEHAGLKEQREKLQRELASFGAGSQAQFQEQFKRLNRLGRELDDGKSRLETLLAQDIALALSGRGLREQLKKSLQGEIMRDKWQVGRQQGDANLTKYLTNVRASLDDVRPDLADVQKEAVVAIASEAWDTLWNPPPTNISESIVHTYLNEMDKLKVVEQLDQLDELGAPAVVELLDSISANDEAYNKLQHEITRTESIAPHVDKKKSDLAAVNGRIQEVDQELGALKREVSVYEADIVKKNTELSKLSGAWDQAKPSLRRASRALKVATMVDSIVNQAVPSQISAVAKAMTQAHHSMAHKKDMVDRIDIDDDCQVRLLNKEGVDLRNYDLSAGEKQIFTQALISAVASVSQRAFPMVIDTPLGRLDVAHRKGVLRHLVQRGHQVILLSTNTEVVGEYLEEIEQNVQKKFLISFERVGDTGESSVREGYFAGQESRQ